MCGNVPHARDHPSGSAAPDAGIAEMGLNTVEPDVVKLWILFWSCIVTVTSSRIPIRTQSRSYNPLHLLGEGSLDVRFLFEDSYFIL